MLRHSSKSGFTLLEMLVASLLLGMLVTILTMVFNSSSIAWRTGKAGVAQLSKVRRQLSYAQYRADSLLPGVDADQPSRMGFVVSPWRLSEQGLRTRAVQDASGAGLGFTAPSFSAGFRSDDSSKIQEQPPWRQVTLSGDASGIKLGSAESFTVGVLSYGPDRKKDTDDDITTWPDKVE